MNLPPSAWTLVGCTAVGKTAVSHLLAEQMQAAVLSADSMLVYRGMNIGTAKPSLAERGRVVYLGIDLIDPAQAFSAGDWLKAVQEQFPATADRGGAAFPRETAPLIVTGGTGLYVKALIAGLDTAAADPVRRAHWQSVFTAEGVCGLRRALAARDPSALARLPDPSNPRRLIRALERLEDGRSAGNRWSHQQPPLVAGLRLPREPLCARIAERVARMFREGLADEVRELRVRYPEWSHTARQAIGYAEVCDWLDGRLTREEAVARTVIRTRQLAKRQETWFRHQLRVEWIDIRQDEPPEEIAPRVREAWSRHGQTPIRWR